MTSILCPQNYVLKATQTNIWFSKVKLTLHLTEKLKTSAGLNCTSQNMETSYALQVILSCLYQNIDDLKKHYLNYSLLLFLAFPNWQNDLRGVVKRRSCRKQITLAL